MDIPWSCQLPHHEAIQVSRIPRKPSEYLRIPPEYLPNTPQGSRQQSALGHEGRGRPPTRQARRLPRPKAPSRKPQSVSCGFRARLPRFPALPPLRMHNLRQVNAATLSLPDRVSQSVKEDALICPCGPLRPWLAVGEENGVNPKTIRSARGKILQDADCLGPPCAPAQPQILDKPF